MAELEPHMTPLRPRNNVVDYSRIFDDGNRDIEVHRRFNEHLNCPSLNADKRRRQDCALLAAGQVSSQRIGGSDCF
jgi:hypothetical protein